VFDFAPATDVPWHLITGIKLHCNLDPQPDSFTLRGTFMTDAPSNNLYFFLFPPQVEILDRRFTVACPPDTERYYWAFDLAGPDRLTHDNVEDIGLPTPEFKFQVSGPTWDKRNDAMIREFHSAKGFDPDSQDAAIAMGYPLVDIEDINEFGPQARLNSIRYGYTSLMIGTAHRPMFHELPRHRRG
jgi:hypothetical protein